MCRTVSAQRTGLNNWLHQRLADALRLPVLAHIDRVDLGHQRAGALRVLQSFAQLLRRRLHQRAMRGDAHRQVERTLGALRVLQTSIARLHSGCMTRDHDLSRRVEVHGFHDFTLRSFAHAASTASSSSPSTAAIAPCPAGTASCMARPRKLTSSTAARKVERVRTDQCRELAEAVSRHHGRRRSATLAPYSPHRDARGEHRGLRTLGRVQDPLPAPIGTASTGRSRAPRKLGERSGRPPARPRRANSASRPIVSLDREKRMRLPWFARSSTRAANYSGLPQQRPATP